MSAKLTGLVADAMVKAMKARRVGRAELARMLDVSPPYVTKLLSGDENVTLAQVVRVLEALRFRLDVRIVRSRPRLPYHYEGAVRLKPCPFCGGAVYRSLNLRTAPNGIRYVACWHRKRDGRGGIWICNAQGPEGRSAAHAIRAWNRRTTKKGQADE